MSQHFGGQFHPPGGAERRATLLPVAVDNSNDEVIDEPGGTLHQIGMTVGDGIEGAWIDGGSHTAVPSAIPAGPALTQRSPFCGHSSINESSRASPPYYVCCCVCCCADAILVSDSAMRCSSQPRLPTQVKPTCPPLRVSN